MRGLYAIIDVASLSQRALDPVRFADAILSVRPAAVQLRDKRFRAEATLRLLREIHGLSAPRGVPLFANDRPDLAILAGCEGVHVGQSDLPPDQVRRVSTETGSAELRIGMSVHDENELDRALSHSCDYLALGPVFGTVSKQNPEPTIGLDGLDRLLGLLRPRFTGPLVAIGNITLESAPAIAGHCDCGAVIGGLLAPVVPPTDDSGHDIYERCAERAQKLHTALTAENTP